MRTIKAYTSYNSYHNIHYYQNFDIIKNLEEIDEHLNCDERVIDIKKIEIDYTMAKEENYNYEVVIYDDFLNKDYTYYYAIKQN